MDNDLNKYFVTVQVYKEDQQVNSITMPKSLIHEIVQKWKFPGSEYDVRVVDYTGNYRFNSTILN
jgi:ribosome-associated toxin RatA of RatAB toxin-antitoxin module